MKRVSIIAVVALSMIILYGCGSEETESTATTDTAMMVDYPAPEAAPVSADTMSMAPEPVGGSTPGEDGGHNGKVNMPTPSSSPNEGGHTGNGGSKSNSPNESGHRGNGGVKNSN